MAEGINVLEALNSDPLIEQGDKLFKERKFVEAIQKYEEACKKNRECSSAFVKWGKALFELKQYDEAKAKYELALSINDKESEAYYRLGLILYRMKDLNGAIEQFKKAVELRESMLDINTTWGKILYDLERESEAMVKFKRGIELNPNDKEAHYNLGVLYRKKEKYKSAIYHYEKAKALDKKFLKAWNSLGVVYYDQRNYMKAISNFNEAINIDNRYREAYLNRGLAYFHLSDTTQALQSFMEGLSLVDDKEKTKEKFKKEIELVQEKLNDLVQDQKFCRLKIDGLKHMIKLLDYSSKSDMLKGVIQHDKLNWSIINMNDEELQNQGRAILADFKLAEYYTFLYRELATLFRKCYVVKGQGLVEQEEMISQVVSTVLGLFPPFSSLPFAEKVFPCVLEISSKEASAEEQKKLRESNGKYQEFIKCFTGFGEVEQTLKLLITCLTYRRRDLLVADYNKEVKSQLLVEKAKGFLKRTDIYSKSEEYALLDLGFLVIICFLEGMVLVGDQYKETKSFVISKSIIDMMKECEIEKDGTRTPYETCNVM